MFFYIPEEDDAYGDKIVDAVIDYFDPLGMRMGGGGGRYHSSFFVQPEHPVPSDRKSRITFTEKAREVWRAFFESTPAIVVYGIGKPCDAWRETKPSYNEQSIALLQEMLKKQNLPPLIISQLNEEVRKINFLA